MEYMFRNMDFLFFSNNIHMYYKFVGAFLISHLSFANVFIIFCNSSTLNFKNIKDLLLTFEKNLGLNINYNESHFITSSLVSNIKINQIANLTSFSHQNLPIKYLGTHIYKGCKRSSNFDGFNQNIFNTFILGIAFSFL